ncbi:hypothetical protein MRBLWO14_000958 [Microbacterium sp. LWO14-1.2]|uniref:hypothetical protein n=1 Tax=Microbacterium sp. LWO14-1.2 TaxID=3135263 RepID=UPI00313A19A6
MVWFKVDDALAFHVKAFVAGNEALGLWVRAGSWSMQQLTDGFVPLGIVLALGGSETSELLVEAQLWEEVEGGYQFHDWAEYQPTREQVQADRAAMVERKRRSREASRSRSRQESRVTDSVTDGVSHSTPTRPDPTRPDLPSTGVEGTRDAPSPFCSKHRPNGPDGKACRACGDARMAYTLAGPVMKSAPIPFTVVPGSLCPEGKHKLLGDGTCIRCEYRAEVA